MRWAFAAARPNASPKSWGVFGDGPAPAVALAYMENGKVDDALDAAKWVTALLDHTLLGTAATDRMFQPERNLGGEALGYWSYDVPGFTPKLHVVERQGDIGAT